MTDFVIVIATAAALVAPTAAPSTSDTVVAASTALQRDPTVGFRTYGDPASCEWAILGLVAAAGARLVCLPVEPVIEEMASAY